MLIGVSLLYLPSAWYLFKVVNECFITFIMHLLRDCCVHLFLSFLFHRLSETNNSPVCQVVPDDRLILN